MISINKLRKRNTSTNNSDDIYNQYIEDYQLYFNNALNKTKYKDKYNDNISGECVILDVSEYNQKNGDEKWITTLPNSNIELLSVIALGFAKDITSYWIVEDKEDLAINSHDKFKISPLYNLGVLSRYGIDNVEVDTKVMDSDNDTTVKKIYFSPKVFNIQRGDLLTYSDANKTYLVKQVQNFTSYPFAESEECNHLTKWMYKGELYDTLSIVTNATKYTEGTKSIGESIVEIQARYSATMPYNEKTKTISIGTRFIINNIAWEVTQTDFTTDVGLLVLTLGKSSVNTETDNLELGVADYYIVKHDYKFDIPSNFNVTKDTSVKLSYSILDNLKDINYDLVEVKYDGSLIQIAKDGKDITIIGKELGAGSITLKVNLTNETKEFNIAFNVVQTTVNEVKYNITTSNGYVYRIKEGSTLIATKYINGNIDNSLVIDYQLDSIGQDLLNKQNISIIKKTDSSFTIRNLNINVLKTFTLTIVDKTTGDKILDNQIITLKGI